MEDITTQVLIEIRDEARKTNEEVRHLGDEVRQLGDEVRKTNERLDGTNSRLDRLERRQTEAEVRISTEIVAVAGAIREMKEAFLEDRRLAAQVNDHEKRIQTLENRGPR
jgi:uncharacterized coiled-coil DUF342 family protein